MASATPAAKADVSIALPVYNGAEFLAEAIQSALAQTQPAHEVIVLDNASTDQSVALARSLLPAGSVRVSPVNAGAVANFNRAVDEATGEYFLWLAADDRLLPRHVELCLKALSDQPDAVAALPAIRYIDGNGHVIREQRDPALGDPDARTRLRSFLRRHRWTETYCLYRREALLRSPRFSAEYGADVTLTWWFLLRGPFATVDEPLLEYREAAPRTVAEMAESLQPGQPIGHWLKIKLWRRLWAMTSEPDVGAVERRAARVELVLSAYTGTAAGHLREDVGLRLAHAKLSRSARDRTLVLPLRVAYHLLDLRVRLGSWRSG